jgi:hypothetical protein
LLDKLALSAKNFSSRLLTAHNLPGRRTLCFLLEISLYLFRFERYYCGLAQKYGL